MLEERDDGLVVVDDLDIDDRSDFVSAVTAAINAAAGSGDTITLDCSKVKTLHEGTIGMLALIARSAQRRGTRVVLGRASKRVRADLEIAGIGHFFD
jgi:anti-anti-sigma regulatory factor